MDDERKDSAEEAKVKIQRWHEVHKVNQEAGSRSRDKAKHIVTNDQLFIMRIMYVDE